MQFGTAGWGGGADVGRELVDGQVVLGGSGGPAYVAP